MSEIHSNWTIKEFQTYLMAYAARSDLSISTEERDVILSLVDMDTYKDILQELAHDNDYQSAMKILKHKERFKYSHEDLEEIFKEIKELFFADGHFDTMEKNIFIALHRLLS